MKTGARGCLHWRPEQEWLLTVPQKSGWCLKNTEVGTGTPRVAAVCSNGAFVKDGISPALPAPLPPLPPLQTMQLHISFGRVRVIGFVSAVVEEVVVDVVEAIVVSTWVLGRRRSGSIIVEVKGR